MKNRKNDQYAISPVKVVNPADYLPKAPPPKSKPNKEMVMVFKAELLDKLGKFQGVITDKAEIKRYTDEILKEENLFYMDRAAAEKDPNFKQLIPYCVLILANKVFVYRRTNKGNESRLHDRFSIGVGGHISPIDGLGKEAYSAAMRRELEEEVSWMGNVHDEMVGLIYDDSDEVGKVHFGIVQTIYLDRFYNQHGFAVKDKALDNFEFSWIMEVLREDKSRFENWSRLILESGVISVP